MMKRLGKVTAVLVAASFLFAAGVELSPWLIKEPGRRIHGTMMAIAYTAACEAQRDRMAEAWDAYQLEQAARYALAKWLAPQFVKDAQAGGCRVKAIALKRNLIPDVAERALRECFIANTGSGCTGTVATWKYHAIGTGAVAAAEADTALGAEATTQYNPDNQRALGTQVVGSSQSIYRTVGLNTVDASIAVSEWGLFNRLSSAAVGQGNGVTDTIWSRIVFATVNLSSGDSLQTTYDLTIE
ncbi:MAG TPA: hypothetical protein VKA83_09360 [Methylomirabilota bacterium]|nr:hypothetical protein [Methylomirabilota bacterium]